MSIRLNVCTLALATAIAVVVIAAVPAVASAQQRKQAIPPAVMCGRSVPVTDAACQNEFDEWQAGEKSWRDNRRTYGNYVTYRGLGVPQVRRPDPPWWMESYCEQERVFSAVREPGPVCEAYDDYLQYDWTQHIDGPQSNVSYVQRVARPTTGEPRGFMDYVLNNLHYDGLWTNGQKSPRVYGLVGTHMTLAHAGRIYLWGPPGILVLRHPGGQLEVKMTWGVDVLVGHVPVPFGPKYTLPLYVTIAKVFGQAEGTSLQKGVNAGLDMVGLSVTIKR